MERGKQIGLRAGVTYGSLNRGAMLGPYTHVMHDPFMFVWWWTTLGGEDVCISMHDSDARSVYICLVVDDLGGWQPVQEP